MNARQDSVSGGSLVDFLGRWPWYHALSDELRALTRATATERVVDAGAYVARAGEPSLHWYGMISGLLQMYVLTPEGAETTLYCLREGEWGGDGSLLKKELRRYDLRALTSARICCIPADTFETLRSRSIAFASFLCDVLNARMGEFVGMLAATRLGTPEMQVARSLLMLANIRDDSEQTIPISQGDLALISGLSRQRVNAAIGVFNDLRIVRSERRKSVLWVDVGGLRAYLQSGMVTAP